MGFGIAASVATNNVAALGALANGVWPMRKVAHLEAERRHRLELELKHAGYGMDGSVESSAAEEPAAA
jgi:Cu2+-exporting ATPase